MELLAKNLVIVALVMAFALVSKPIAAKGQATMCGMTAEGFDFCKPSVQTGVNPLPPSQSCCSALEKANLGCLCFFKKNYPKVLSENNIDPNLAMHSFRRSATCRGLSAANRTRCLCRMPG